MLISVSMGMVHGSGKWPTTWALAEFWVMYSNESIQQPSLISTSCCNPWFGPFCNLNTVSTLKMTRTSLSIIGKIDLQSSSWREKSPISATHTNSNENINLICSVFTFRKKTLSAGELYDLSRQLEGRVQTYGNLMIRPMNDQEELDKSRFSNCWFRRWLG